MRAFRLPRRQHGLGLWSGLFLFGTIGFYALIAVKAFPIYINEFNIRKAVHQVANQGYISGGEVDVQGIRGALQKQWDIDYINELEAKDVQIVRTERGIELSYEYEARAKLFYNIFLVFHFAEDVPLVSAKA